MPAMAPGVVDDFTILGNQRVIDMEPVIAQLEPDETPLLTLLQKLEGNSRSCYSQTFEWLEDELNPRYAKAAATFLVGAASITMTSPTGLYFKSGDIIHNEQTSEKMLVTSSTATAINVTRGVAGSTAAPNATANDGLIRIGSIAMEGDTLPAMVQTKKVRNFNYAQIVRTPFGFTETIKASKLYGQGDVMGYEANKQATDHKRSWETSFFVGSRSLDTSLAHPKAYTGGLMSFITSNIQTTATLKQSDWESFLMLQSRFGSNRKVVICAPIIMSALASWPAGRLSPPDPDTTTSWGVQIRKYRAANGFAVDIAEHRDWMDFTAGTYSLGGSAFCLDMDNIKRRYLRDTRLLPNRAARDEDSDKQEYLTEQGLCVMHERKHGWLRGVTAYAP